MAKAPRQMEREVERLKTAIERLILRSRRFAGIRRLLRHREMEIQIYLVPIAGRPKSSSTSGVRLRLTDEDRRFLKQAGIRF